MIDLTDRVVILTGASSQVGEAIATKLVGAGATVVLGYNKNMETIERLMQEFAPLPGMGTPYSLDVTSRASVDAMVAETMERFGQVDVLIHNANATIDRHPFLERDWDGYKAQIDVILKGGFNCCQAVLEEMVLRRQGRILFILNALISRPVIGYNNYTTAVSAVKGMARDLANEVGEVGIAVNTLSPGFTITDHTPHAPPHIQQSLAGQTPLRRLAEPRDIANAALFFASDLSGFVTGEDLTIDGGYTFGYTGHGPEQ